MYQMTDMATNPAVQSKYFILPKITNTGHVTFLCYRDIHNSGTQGLFSQDIESISYIINFKI